MRICNNCGYENKEEANFCESCGTKFEDSNIVEAKPIENKKDEKEPNNIDNKKGDELGWISLFLFFGGGIIARFFGYVFTVASDNVRVFSALSGLMVLFGIVLMIYGRIRYPKNKTLKSAMIAMIVAIILAIIYFIIMAILMFILCNTIRNLD